MTVTALVTAMAMVKGPGGTVTPGNATSISSIVLLVYLLANGATRTPTGARPPAIRPRSTRSRRARGPGRVRRHPAGDRFSRWTYHPFIDHKHSLTRGRPPRQVVPGELSGRAAHLLAEDGEGSPGSRRTVAAAYNEPRTRVALRPRMARRQPAGIRADSRWRRETGLCQRLGSRSAPHRAQPAAYGVTRSPHWGQ